MPADNTKTGLPDKSKGFMTFTHFMMVARFEIVLATG